MTALARILCAALLFGLAAFVFLPSLFNQTEVMGVKWPPEKGHVFPELTLRDTQGRPFSLYELYGKVVAVQFVGMSCEACNAFSGGHQKGGFQGVTPQQGLDAFDFYLPRYAPGATRDHPDFALVQIVLFNLDLKAPSNEELRLWSDHFGLEAQPNTYVLAGTPEMVNNASFDLVPGFMLLNRDFTIVSDSTGTSPDDDLYTEFLPMIPGLLNPTEASHQP